MNISYVKAIYKKKCSKNLLTVVNLVKVLSYTADVFWYKEEAKDIEQIDESDRVDINFSNGQHSLEIYNTTKEDEGTDFNFI